MKEIMILDREAEKDIDLRNWKPAGVLTVHSFIFGWSLSAEYVSLLGVYRKNGCGTGMEENNV